MYLLCLFCFNYFLFEGVFRIKVLFRGLSYSREYLVADDVSVLMCFECVVLNRLGVLMFDFVVMLFGKLYCLSVVCDVFV